MKRPLFPRSKLWKLAACAAVALGICGCQSFNFYRQAVVGQCSILANERPVAAVIADPKTPPELRDKLAATLKMREFAARELKLPAAGSYLKYVDLHRPFVVWNVNMTPALSFQPKTWWYPFVGRASYRGYFSEKAARGYADKWGKLGWDVNVSGVEAYSTLGWFRDPLMSTWLDGSEGDVAETIFHELAHQRLFIPGDTDFNEAFATAVSLEGVRRWFAAAGHPDEYQRYRTALKHDSQFVQLILVTRRRLEAVYADGSLSDAEKLHRKQDIIDQMRREYAQLKGEWGRGDYDGWFKRPINNARLDIVSTYYDLVPAFEGLLRTNNGDFDKFYAAVAALGKLPPDQRHAALLSGKHEL